MVETFFCQQPKMNARLISSRRKGLAFAVAAGRVNVVAEVQGLNFTAT